MSKTGFSAERLTRLHDIMAGHIARGVVPGVVTLVSRRGDTHVDAIGTLTFDGSAPMQRDTVFRITSMTKPLIAAAAMILVEECRLRLDDPVDGLLPELADRRVLRRLDGPLDDTVPASRPITLRDLLTFRSGFGIILGSPDEYPILQALADEQIIVGPPKPPTPHRPDEWMRRLGAFPLMHQPGERWMYHGGTMILGVLIARAANQSLETFLEERIFAPLDMVDTAFQVPAGKRDRLATCYAVDPATGTLVVEDDTDGQWSQPPAFPNGSDGLVSTVDDFLAFGQMLLNQGNHRGLRILSRPSVATMTADQIPLIQKRASDFFPGPPETRGWGLGMAVVTGRDDLFATPGRFGWDGGYGTSWYSDPAERLVGILMSQRLQGWPPTGMDQDFWTSVYAAIDD